MQEDSWNYQHLRDYKIPKLTRQVACQNLRQYENNYDGEILALSKKIDSLQKKIDVIENMLRQLIDLNN